MAESEPPVRVERLRVVRGGRTVLPDLSFEVPRGEVVGLLGPSGCGKTTLLRVVMGVQAVAGGAVTVLGHPAGSAALRRSIGYAAQTPAVYSDLTVAENLAYFASVLGAPKGDPGRVLDEVGLGDHARRVVGRLSGGQQARASLAVALLGAPELLVLDEPTVGLDPVLREELWRLFADLARRGTTLLVSSHVMDEAGRCDRLLLMRQGELVAASTPARLRAETGTGDLDEAFLRLIRRTGGRVRGRHEAPPRRERPR